MEMMDEVLTGARCAVPLIEVETSTWPIATTVAVVLHSACVCKSCARTPMRAYMYACTSVYKRVHTSTCTRVGTRMPACARSHTHARTARVHAAEHAHAKVCMHAEAHYTQMRTQRLTCT